MIPPAMRAPQKVAIVMSRLTRLVSPDETWLLGLRAVLRRVHRQGVTVLVGERTSGADLIRRGCERLGIACFQVEASDEVPSSALSDEAQPTLPVADRAVVSNAEQIFVLGLRPEGNQHRLLRQQLQESAADVLLVDLPGLQPPLVKAELLELGAQIWTPSLDECSSFQSTAVSSAELLSSIKLPHGERQVFQIEPAPHLDGSDWLFHTTRSCPGPWPETSLSDYLDSLFDEADEADHSALSALKRIARQRRLISSDQAIRGKFRVVSFSACSLEELCGLREFRRHRMRWDFEPYGIGIRRDWLMARGARPVVYGDDELWRTLSENDRPFFQAVSSAMDWSSEREWRHLGDLNLDSLTNDDVILIVPTFDQAKSLAAVTDWPTTLWPMSESR